MSLDASFQFYQKIRVAEQAKGEILMHKQGGGAQDAFYQLFADMQKADYAPNARTPAKDSVPEKKDYTRASDKPSACAAPKPRQAASDEADAPITREDTAPEENPAADASAADDAPVAPAAAQTQPAAAQDVPVIAAPLMPETAAPTGDTPQLAELMIETGIREEAGQEPLPAHMPLTLSVPQAVQGEALNGKGGKEQAAAQISEAEALTTISFRADPAQHDAAPAALRNAKPELPGSQTVFIKPETAGRTPEPLMAEKLPEEKPKMLVPMLQAAAETAPHPHEQAPDGQGAAYQQAQEQHALKKDLRSEPRLEAGTRETIADEFVSLPTAGNRVSAPPISTYSPPPNALPGGGTPLWTPVKADAAAAADGIEMAPPPIANGNVAVASLVRQGKETASAALLLPTEQVAIQLHRMAKSDTDRFEIQLHPADMGRVDVSLQIDKDGLVRAIVTADNQQSFDLLQKDSRSLERALQQAGLQTDSGSLSFNLRGGDKQGQQAQNDKNGQPAWAHAAREPEIDETIISYRAANGRVDIRI